MTSEDGLERYLDAAIGEGLHSNRGHLRFQVQSFFQGIDFENRTVLDIGGGSGLCSFYAACRGARQVVCLEPEAAGSSSGARERFRRMAARLWCTNVAVQPQTLQAFEPAGHAFDVIVLYNSINHIDEGACLNLTRDDKSRLAYRNIFARLYALSAAGAKLVIGDCSRHNFFALLGMRNPFAPTIEWQKHHAPETWAALLEEAGFANPAIGWSPLNRLRQWGAILSGNRLAAYFLMSHFRLTMERLWRPPPATAGGGGEH